MGVSLRPLRDQVMVITGASSGIGLVTARAAAKQGARLVLTARNGEALNDVVRNLGPQAVAVPGDIADPTTSRRVADEAVRRFGRIDTWVNNAGTSVFGKLDEVPMEDHRTLFETNYWGLVYGSLVAALHLRQGGGAIINLGSVASDVTLPLQVTYSATKHAVKGFTDGLRMELEMERAPVSVTLIKPASIDTPFPQNATNYMDVEPKLPEPVYAPEDVAAAILRAATHPVRDVYVGTAGPGMTATHTVSAGMFDWLGETVMGPRQRTSEPPRDPRGTLRRPGRGGRTHGEMGAKPRGGSGALLTTLAVSAVGVGLAAWMSAKR